MIGVARRLFRFSACHPASRPNKGWRAPFVLFFCTPHTYNSAEYVPIHPSDQEDALNIFSQIVPVWLA